MAELPPSAVQFLASVTKAHCERHGIRSVEARESVAASVLAIYERGIRDELKILALLDAEDNPTHRDNWSLQANRK